MLVHLALSVMPAGAAPAQSPNTVAQDEQAPPYIQLSEEQEALAREIHAAVITLDTHKDISSDLASTDLPESSAERESFLQKTDPTRRGPNQVDFPKMREGGLDVAFYIVYVGQGPLTAEGFATSYSQANAKFEAIHRMAQRFPEHIALAVSPDDVERIHAAGKLVACIGIENGYAMGDDLTRIEEFYRKGARYMSIAATSSGSGCPSGAVGPAFGFLFIVFLPFVFPSFLP